MEIKKFIFYQRTVSVWCAQVKKVIWKEKYEHIKPNFCISNREITKKGKVNSAKELGARTLKFSKYEKENYKKSA